MNDPRLFYLTIERIKDRSTHRCRLIATSLDEALRTARANYGPIKLLASGTRDLALGHSCLGSGLFIASRYDSLLQPQTICALRQPY